jgi:lysophospholipase L1-like esterase
MNRFKITLTQLFLILPSVYLQAQTSTPEVHLRAGDRVITYGDSITAQRLYTRFLEDIFVSRSGLHIEFHNAGVSGDTVAGGSGGIRAERVRRDVIPLRPTLVTIMLGMNDGLYRIDHPADIDDYRTGYSSLLDQLRTSLPTTTIMVVKPSAYDEVTRKPRIPGYNRRLQQLGAVAESLAHDRHMPVCDLNTPMVDALQKAQAIDPTFAASLLPDHVHPSEAGHWVLALALARCLGVDPVVSNTVLNAADLQVVESRRTAISLLRREGNSIAWTSLEEGLPLPLELQSPVTELLTRITPLAESEQEMLSVRNLAEGQYALLIDDSEVGHFSAAELSSGINLSLLPTPMQTASRPIDWMTDSRAKISATRFNLLTASPAIPGTETSLTAIDELDHRLEASEWESAQPKPHRFQLVVKQ